MFKYLSDTVCTFNWGGLLEMPTRVNWVPGVHDKVHQRYVAPYTFWILDETL